MAMGKPIIASAVSDLPKVLDGCARLVPPGDAAQLAAAIEDLLHHPDEARAMGEQARKRCLEKFSMKQVGETLRDVVRRVLPGSV